MLVVKRSGLCLHHIQLYWVNRGGNSPMSSNDKTKGHDTNTLLLSIELTNKCNPNNIISLVELENKEDWRITMITLWKSCQV
jgi:hypothetical protein